MKQGIVTSPHPLASRAGADVLARGGTAAEACVAMAAMLAVVTPHFCGLGGDAVWLLADREGRATTLLGIGQAGQGVSNIPPGAALPLRGAGAMLTTACAVDSWGAALDYSAAHWRGGMAFADLIAPALQVAREGFIPGASQEFWLNFRTSDWPDWPGFAKHFSARAADGSFRQPELAEILALLAEDGPRSFYEGRAALRLAQGLADAGALLTADDLQNTVTRSAAPVATDYRGLTLLAPPPPTQGLATLGIMAILERFDLAATSPGSAERMHLIVEAVKQAFLQRPLIADPDMGQDVTDIFLNPARVARRADAIARDRALSWPHPYQHGDTVYLGAHDGRGQAASLLASTYFDWGSGVVVGDTGILWQNRGAAFSTDPTHPNCIAPGKRPFYTLNPGIALRDGLPSLLYGTQGADGQPQTLSVVLTSLIDDGLAPEEALAQARFLLGRTFSDGRDSLKVEGHLPGQTTKRLRELGHDLSELPALSPIFGAAGVIRIGADGAVSGAHDPRGEGISLTV